MDKMNEIHAVAGEPVKANTLMTVDPLGAYKGTPNLKLLEACGLLLVWTLHRDNGEKLTDAIERCYAFYAGQMTGGRVAPTGAYEFPGDEPLSPYVELETPEGERMFIYPYAIVGAIPADPDAPQWVSRCD